MLQIFKKWKSRRIEGQATVLSSIKDKAIRLQHNAAGYLNERTAGWQPYQLKLALLVFCLLSGTASVFIIVFAIREPPSSKEVIVQPITVIKHIPSEPYAPGLWLSKNEYARIEKFRHYMDSLGTTSDGGKIKDSLLKQRPKLMDSLALIEQLYNKQK